MNINQSLPPETLLSSFKRLDTKQVVKVRAVCKRWLELITDDVSFWRILNLSVPSFESSLSVIDQFDKASGSTLREVSIQVQEGPTYSDLVLVVDSLQMSSQSDLVLILKLLHLSWSLVGAITELLLSNLPYLVDVRFGVHVEHQRVRLLRETSQSFLGPCKCSGYQSLLGFPSTTVVSFYLSPPSETSWN